MGYGRIPTTKVSSVENNFTSYTSQNSHFKMWLPMQMTGSNRPLSSSKNPHLENETKRTTLLVRMSFISMRTKNHFHIKGWELNLVLIQRPGGTRNWPIGQLLFLSLITVPEAFTEVSSPQFLLVSKSGGFIKVTKNKTSNLVTLKILSKRTQRRTLIPIGRWFIASTMANSSKLLITTWEERINKKQIKNKHKLCSLCLRAKYAHRE